MSTNSGKSYINALKYFDVYVSNNSLSTLDLGEFIGKTNSLHVGGRQALRPS